MGHQPNEQPDPCGRPTIRRRDAGRARRRCPRSTDRPASSTPVMPRARAPLGRGRTDADHQRRAPAAARRRALEGGVGRGRGGGGEDHGVGARPSAPAAGRRVAAAPPSGRPRPAAPPIPSRSARRGWSTAPARRTGTAPGCPTSRVIVSRGTRPPIRRARCSTGTRSGSTPAASQGVGRGRADRRHQGRAQRPGVAQLAHEPCHRVDRREDDPAEAAHLLRRGAQGGAPVAGLGLLGQGDARSVAAPARCRASTRPRARGPDRVTTTVRPDSGAGDGAGRRRTPRAATGPTTITAGDPSVTSASRPSVVRTTAWSAWCPARSPPSGVDAGLPPRWSAVGDLGPVHHPHEDHQGPVDLGQGLPVDAAVDRVVHPAGHHGHRRGEATVGDRNADGRRNPEGRGDTGDDLPGHAGTVERPRPPRRRGRTRRDRRLSGAPRSWLRCPCSTRSRLISS